MKHPYENQPEIAFWSRSVASNFQGSSLLSGDQKLFLLKDKVVSAGSCFASNLIPYIEKAGIEYIRTESQPKIFSELGENLGYANFSAAYGNIYTARQLLQLYKRSLGIWYPSEEFWISDGKYIDPFRPGLKFPASSADEFRFLTNSHLKATRLAFESADVFVFTFGLTEAWRSKVDGAVFPACPGTVAGDFDENKHEFNNFEVDEIVEDVTEFIELLRSQNPNVRFIFSVSPVPLVATATQNHVLSATTYSKSVLRVAAEIITRRFENTHYFPAFELITGIQAPKDLFESDLRNVSSEGVEFVMNVLLSSSELSENFIQKGQRFIRKLTSQKDSKEIALSKAISEAECDEVMLDKNLTN